MPTAPEKGIWKVITASSLGTLIEWYDFYIFGSLSTIIAAKFFPSENPTAALLSTLATFAAGFIVRPFGALVFGRIGDMIGRKYTFLLTLVLMGISTFLIGLVPSYASIGALAPILVLILRLVQGLALGGEYGGAATYVAEHSPIHKRGFYTSWIQTTATLGLFLSLSVILLTRNIVGVEEFEQGNGWRYPFLLSILLVVVSIIIRVKMKESPLFAKLKSEGKTSVNPLKESFGNKLNFKLVLLALFGGIMGQGVIWYTSQFYAQTFLETKCNIEFEQSRMIILWAIVLATPFFVFFGWLSDKVGRKWIMLTGMLLGVIFYRPIFSEFLHDSNVDSSTHYADSSFRSDEKKSQLNQEKDSLITFTVYDLHDDGKTYNTVRSDTLFADMNQYWKAVQNDIGCAGCPHELKDLKNATGPFIKYGESKEINIRLDFVLYWKFVFLVWLMIMFVTMVYGPVAAFLVELFPTKIRYTSMSLPYHIGNGVFGGLVPFIATLITTLPGTTPLAGLWYPILVAGLCFIIGALYLSNKVDEDVTD